MKNSNTHIILSQFILVFFCCTCGINHKPLDKPTTGFEGWQTSVFCKIDSTILVGYNNHTISDSIFGIKANILLPYGYNWQKLKHPLFDGLFFEKDSCIFFISCYMPYISVPLWDFLAIERQPYPIYCPFFQIQVPDDSQNPIHLERCSITLQEKCYNEKYRDVIYHFDLEHLDMGAFEINRVSFFISRKKGIIGIMGLSNQQTLAYIGEVG